MNNILVVEDDELTRAAYRCLFRRFQGEFECRLEPTGEEALAFLERGPVDAVILDWDLPGISGLEVLKRIRAGGEAKATRIFVVTGRDEPSVRALALSEGADDFISKPFSPEKLLSRLRASA